MRNWINDWIETLWIGRAIARSAVAVDHDEDAWACGSCGRPLVTATDDRHLTPTTSPPGEMAELDRRERQILGRLAQARVEALRGAVEEMYGMWRSGTVPAALVYGTLQDIADRIESESSAEGVS